MFEAYKVATTLSLTNKVSGVLAVIASDFAKTDRSAKQLAATLNGLTAKQLALTGAVVGGAGFFGLKAIGAMVKPATEYVHQLELAKAAGMSHLEIARATAAAWQTAASVMTTTPTENLKAIREPRMVFGDTRDAVAFLPQMQRLQGVLDAVLHGAGGVGAKDVAFTAAKMLELRGASMNPQAFGQQADLIAKAVIASGGKVTPQMLLQAQKYGGIGTTSFSNDFLFGMLPTLVQELGGSSTGTSLTSMYRAVVGGRMDKRSLAVWQALGLADTSHADVGKDLAMLRPQAIKGSDLFKTNPFRYVQEVLLPALVAHGVTSPADQSAAIDRLFSNRTAGRIANILGTQGPRLTKDFDLIGQAGSTASYDAMLRNDPVMARKALGDQWDTLKTSIGVAVVPVLLPARGLTTAFNTLGEFLHRHPTMTSALTLTFTALSGLAVVSGGLMVAGAALKVIGPAWKAVSIPLQVMAGIPLAGMASGLGLLTAALAALAPILYHRQIAGWVDGHAPGVGDALLATRDVLTASKPAANGNRGFAPPSPGGTTTVHTQVNLDGRQIAAVVSRHQAAAANGPASSGSAFDARQGFTPPGYAGGVVTVLLTLGGIVFEDFEVPDVIRTGGEHALVVHKLPGGARTVDAMGADDADIPWAGRFRGAQAESRARILEGYRKSGQQFLLQWSTYRYQVVVQSFRCDYQQPFEIPYQISCLVVADESAPALFGIPVLDELIGSDLGTALGLSQSAGVAAVATAVTTAQQAVTTAGTLRNAPASTLTQVAGTLAAAQQAVGASITGATAAAATATPVTAGGNPAAMAGGLTAQATSFGQLTQLYQLSGTLTRMARNITA